MTETIAVNAIQNGTIRPMTLTLRDGRAEALLPRQSAADESQTLYLSDGFIDSHAHVYDGATDLGVSADRIGYQTGVHLVVDAGSAGAINFPCFRDYVMPAHETPVLAFLNISRVGLVTKQPYFDPRVIDVATAVQALKADGGQKLLGIKVLSSGLVVEKAGLEPLRAGVQAARECGVPVMVHLVEGPPANEDTMPMLQKGDIITHCFHGAPNLEANRKASRGAALNLEFCSVPNVMWNPDGTPVKPLEEALNRGVYLDVGHGAGSLDMDVARCAIAAGARNFSISSDAHIRNVEGVVRSLPHVMSKFLALGMTLEQVIDSVTRIPARQLGIQDWCGHPLERATLFALRPVRPEDGAFLDAYKRPVPVTQVIEPKAVIRGGRLSNCRQAIKEGPYGGDSNPGRAGIPDRAG